MDLRRRKSKTLRNFSISLHRIRNGVVAFCGELNALSLEILKNLILNGVGKLILYEIMDDESQSIISAPSFSFWPHIMEYLPQLNPDVKVELLSCHSLQDIVKSISEQVGHVFFVSACIEDAIKLNDHCRNLGVHFTWSWSTGDQAFFIQDWTNRNRIDHKPIKELLDDKTEESRVAQIREILQCSDEVEVTVSAVIGAIISQELLKSISGQTTPMKQLFTLNGGTFLATSL